MKINLNALTGRIRQSVRRASKSSVVLFILTCLSGLYWLFSGRSRFEINELFLLTGLMGVLWLSSIALHYVKRGGRRFNPFLPMISLCLVVIGLCQLMVWLYPAGRYNERNEPLNRATDTIRALINEEGAQIEKFLSETGMFSYPDFDTSDFNAILTDADGKILSMSGSFAAGTLKTGDTMHALICPAKYETGNGLMILTDEKGTVISSLRINNDNSNYVHDAGISALTLRDEADRKETIVESPQIIDPSASDEESPIIEPAQPLSRSAFQEKYFPSFGATLDQYAIKLTSAKMNQYSAIIYISSWQGEEITHIDLGESRSAEHEVMSALNAMDDAERERFKSYIAWLSAAMRETNSSGGVPRYARIITGKDDARVYLLYEGDTIALRQYYPIYAEQAQRNDRLNDLSLCMIPAIIVFLAFWVFVDAKKRGQSRPALWAALTLIGNVVTWIIYLMVRPQMAVGVTGQKVPRGECPICGTKLKNDFIACPGCGILLRSRCKNCGRALENDWSFCPYCTEAVVKEIPAEQ